MIRTAIAIFAMSVLTLAGCKSEPVQPSAPADAAAVKPSVLRVQGRVASPILAGARVSLYPVIAGQADEQQLLARTSTNVNGQFSLSLGYEHLDKPAVLVVEQRPGETAIECIVNSGCGSDRPFGTLLPLDEAVTLRTGVPRLGLENTLNPTLLTELAVRLAESQQMAGGQELARLIQESNHRIASRFDIIGTLPSRPVVDIADISELMLATNDTIKYSAMTPAIVAAVLEQHPGRTAPWAMNYFNEQYVRLGLVNRSNLSNLITASEIYDHLLPIIERHKQHLDLTVLASEVSALKILVRNDALNQFDQGTVSGVEGLSDIGKAKAFVKNVRQVASSIDLKKIGSLSSLSSFVNGDASSALDAFGVDVKVDSLLASTEFKAVSAVLKRSAYTAFYVLGEHYAGRNAVSPYDGIAFTFTDHGDLKEIHFNGSVNGCPEQPAECPVVMDLTISGTFDYLTGNLSSQAVLADNMSLQLHGGLTSDVLALQFTSAEQRIQAHRLYYRKTDSAENGWQNEGHFFDVENADISVPFRIIHLHPDNELNVAGVISASVDKAKGEYLSRTSQYAGTEGGTEEAKQVQYVVDELQGLNLEFGGLLDNFDEDTFVASLNMKQGAMVPVTTIIYSKNSIEKCSEAVETGCETTDSVSAWEGETDTNFLDLTVTTIFKANLKGVAEPVLIGLSGSRDNKEGSKINHMKVTYPGHALVLDGEFNQSGAAVRLNAVNLDGMQMKLESMASGERYGAVTDFGGDQHATIKDMGTWIKITFEDGDFESM